MKLFRSIEELEKFESSKPQAAIVTIGTFDGVHLGHRAVVSRAVSRAAELGMKAVVFTFSNHPFAVTRPQHVPPSLTTPPEKVALLAQLGPDAIVMVPFNPALAATTAEDFVNRILIRSLGARGLVVGSAFRLGRNGEGDVTALKRIAAESGISMEAVPTCEVEGVPVSSTAIRSTLALGELAKAETMLGRRYSISGPIVKGEGRGRTLGFPTANVQAPRGRLLPACGVYLAELRWQAGFRLAIVNVGFKPTFGGHNCTVEAFIPGFSGDLYGVTTTVHFVAYLRPERTYQGSDELVAQIRDDLEKAHELAALIYKPDVLW